MNRKKLVVIEGTDGSGKATQTERLRERLVREGFRVEKRDFPNYKNFFGVWIGKFLSDPKYNWVHVHPMIASVFYAVNRWMDKDDLVHIIKHNDMVIFDRYVSANQIHQGGKIRDIDERREFLKTLDKLEYEVFGLPKPQIIFFLDLPIDLSEKLMEKRNQESSRDYLKGEKDVHETNSEFKKNSYETALWLAKTQPGWIKISCHKDGEIRSVDDIHEEIYTKLMDFLKKTHL